MQRDSLSLDDVLADGFVIGAILLCWWVVAGVVSLPGLILGGSIVVDALNWFSMLLMLTGLGNAFVYALARGIVLSDRAHFP